jgi:hypothetical protein
MARSIKKAGVQPWPDRHRCDDGKVRSLSIYIAEEWANHPEVVRGSVSYPPGDGRGVWMSHRLRAARSLGRNPLAVVSRMSGRGARRNLPFT